ncbi:MAG TPA: hypothetical protein VGE07_21375, partial [Herpetosiphonaceae bacterium]
MNVFSPAVGLMNRLKYLQKFALITLLFACPLALVIYLFFSEVNAKIAFAERESQGIAYLRPLRQLLQHALEQRIIAHDSYAMQLDAMVVDRFTAQVESDLQLLAPVAGRLGAEFRTAQRYEALLASWAAIRQPDPGRTQAASDQLHTQFIADIRALIALVGDNSNLILDPDLDSYYLMDTILLKLPAGQDLLSQAMFKGEGLLDRRAVTTDERIEMIVLGG